MPPASPGEAGGAARAALLAPARGARRGARRSAPGARRSALGARRPARGIRVSRPRPARRAGRLARPQSVTCSPRDPWSTAHPPIHPPSVPVTLSSSVRRLRDVAAGTESAVAPCLTVRGRASVTRLAEIGVGQNRVPAPNNRPARRRNGPARTLCRIGGATDPSGGRSRATTYGPSNRHHRSAPGESLYSAGARSR